MTRHFFLLPILIISIKTFSQDSHGLHFLRNDSVKFDIVLVSRSVVYNRPTKNYVIMEIPKKTKKFFLRQNLEYWKSKLADTTSDWAANLVLYSIYEKDAFILKHYKDDVDKWRLVKNREIEEWDKFFRAKKVK